MHKKESITSGAFKVLIVEDSPTQAAMLEKILKDRGYGVIKATNGQHAMNLLASETPSVIVSDVIMPEMDGYELCSATKEDPELRDIPFVLLTSLSDPADVLKGLECGADHFITKPYREEYLISRLNYLLANQHVRSNEEPQMGLQIIFNGKRHLISSDRLQILNLLLSTYEAAVQQNKELLEAQRHLRAFNQKLEELVDERTRELRLEIHQKELAQQSLEQVNRNLKVLSGCNQSLVRINNEKALFHQISRILVELGTYYIAWTGVTNGHKNSLLEPVSFFSLQNDKFPYLPNYSDVGLSDDLLQKTMSTGRIQVLNISENQAQEPDLATFAGEHDIQTVLLLPLVIKSKKLGVIALFSKDAEVFNGAEERLLLEVAEDVGYGVNGLRMEAENKKLAKDIAEREVIFHTLFDASPIGFCLIDENDTIVDFNDALLSFNDFPSEYLKGSKSIREMFYNFDEYDTLLKERIGGRPLIGKELLFRKFDGYPYCVSLSLIPVNIQNHAFLYAIIEDITQRKKDQEEIVESEKRYRDLFEKSVNPIFITDTSLNITDINKASMKLLGYCKHEITKFTIDQIFLDETDVDFFMSELVKEGNDIHDFECKLIRKDDVELDCLISATQRTREDNTLQGYVIILRDITESKRIQAQFEQAQKMEAIGRLAGGVAHDFNNLLTVILGECDLLFMSRKDDKKLLKDLDEIRRAAESASNLTRQMLAFSRKQTLNPKVLSLNNIVTNLERMLKRIIGEDIELETFFAEDLPKVKIDPGQIEQVIANLTVNARDAMPMGGKLTIETSVVALSEEFTSETENLIPGKYVLMAVSDTGQGMTKEVQQRLFEPFFTTKEAGKGTGLGLATVYGIVKQSGGAINVYSELEKGTVFKIYLPISDDQAESKIAEKSQPKTMPIGKERILVVEDEDGVRNLAVRVLRGQGYRVDEAPTGNEAASKCKTQEQAYDLILSDIIMPGMSGDELSEMLKKSCPQTRMLFMSGYTERGVFKSGILKEGAQFLPKPFRPIELAIKVREVLDM